MAPSANSRRADEDLRLVGNGEVDGVGDEASFVRVLVKRARLLEVGTGDDPHLGAQRHLAKSDAAVDLGHRTRRAILVRDDHELGPRGDGQVRKTVARRERSDEQVLGVVERRVAAKSLGGGADQRRLAVEFDAVGAIVGFVRSDRTARCARPHQAALEAMFIRAFDGHGVYARAFTIFEATNANKPRINPETMPMTGPVMSIISRGESGIGILTIMAASSGC